MKSHHFLWIVPVIVVALSVAIYCYNYYKKDPDPKMSKEVTLSPADTRMKYKDGELIIIIPVEK